MYESVVSCASRSRVVGKAGVVVVRGGWDGLLQRSAGQSACFVLSSLLLSLRGAESIPEEKKDVFVKVSLFLSLLTFRRCGGEREAGGRHLPWAGGGLAGSGSWSLNSGSSVKAGHAAACLGEERRHMSVNYMHKVQYNFLFPVWDVGVYR
jgi:hypothetical protein